LAGPASVSLASNSGFAQQATPINTVEAEWPLYGHDFFGTRASAATGITSDSAALLSPAWELEVGGPVSATPVIADGMVYIGSYDGNLYAIDLRSGNLSGQYATGAEVMEPNLQIPLGIPGSAAVADETVYVGDAAAVVHAIDVSTGEARWTTKVDDQPNACIWSSPVFFDNMIYVGVASIAKEVGFRGSVVALDAVTGELAWQTHMVPENADGAGVFAVPAIDPDRGRLYVGTQNAYSPAPAPYGNPISMVALDLGTGEVAWAFNAPPGGGETAPTDDVAFSASPNLFSESIDSQQCDLVGNGQKSGDYWVLDRDSGQVVWTTKVSPAGFLGGMEGSSAVSNGVVAIPATDWPEFDGPAAGLVTALDAATGDMLWTVEQDAPAASPASIADDVVLQAGMDGILHAYALADGTELVAIDLEASVSGGIAVSNEMVVLGAATPAFAPFVKPGNTVRAFSLTAASATPVVGTPEG
jgi:polyvinyl alcohol dehydrogenase (cytochrome)